jgi:hypothetical protein
MKNNGIRILMIALLLQGCAASSGHHVAQGQKEDKASAGINSINVLKSYTAYTPAQPHIGTFLSVVSQLQKLNYLPIVNAHERLATKEKRHDLFKFTVPSALQKEVDSYAWNKSNPFIRGAIIQFERANGILKEKGMSEGAIHKNVISRLFSKDAVKDPYPYQWIEVNKADGTDAAESLHIWENKAMKGSGQWVDSTEVNTGVLKSTPNGTWPIYQRLPVTTMVGYFPVPVSEAAYLKLKNKQRGHVDGHPVHWKHYDDHGILWVSYFDRGRGLHYYPRAKYGFPQSAGCVEEPYKSAKVVYKLVHYGAPVTISSKSWAK